MLWSVWFTGPRLARWHYSWRMDRSGNCSGVSHQHSSNAAELRVLLSDVLLEIYSFKMYCLITQKHTAQHGGIPPAEVMLSSIICCLILPASKLQSIQSLNTLKSHFLFCCLLVSEKTTALNADSSILEHFKDFPAKVYAFFGLFALITEENAIRRNLYNASV